MNLVRISDALSLALHTLLLLAQSPDKRWTTGQISQALSASANHLAKVHTRLVNHGLLRSARGPGGGLMLGKPAEQIRLVEVYTAIEGTLPQTTCLLGRPVCNGKECIFGHLLDDVNTQFIRYFQDTALSDLVNNVKVSL